MSEKTSKDNVAEMPKKAEPKKAEPKKEAVKKEASPKKQESNKKFLYLPKNLECKIIDDSHKKFYMIQIGESQPIMVRKHLVSSK